MAAQKGWACWTRYVMGGGGARDNRKKVKGGKKIPEPINQNLGEGEPRSGKEGNVFVTQGSLHGDEDLTNPVMEGRTTCKKS